MLELFQEVNDDRTDLQGTILVPTDCQPHVARMQPARKGYVGIGVAIKKYIMSHLMPLFMSIEIVSFPHTAQLFHYLYFHEMLKISVR